MTINLGRPATTPCPSGETTFCIIHSTFTPLMNPLQLCWPLSICVNTIQKWTKSRTIAEATDNRVADYQKPFCKKKPLLWWPHIYLIFASIDLIFASIGLIFASIGLIFARWWPSAPVSTYSSRSLRDFLSVLSTQKRKNDAFCLASIYAIQDYRFLNLNYVSI